MKLRDRLKGIFRKNDNTEEFFEKEMEYEITEVKICRDISGKVRAVRCTTLNN